MLSITQHICGLKLWKIWQLSRVETFRWFSLCIECMKFEVYKFYTILLRLYCYLLCRAYCYNYNWDSNDKISNHNPSFSCSWLFLDKSLESRTVICQTSIKEKLRINGVYNTNVFKLNCPIILCFENFLFSILSSDYLPLSLSGTVTLIFIICLFQSH